jgi:thiamine-monophosphate kinase
MATEPQKIAQIGEKRIIREFIKPLFNATDDPAGVGDDCAMVEFGEEVALLSSDRVPADLTGFRLGILDYCGLGDYLARLNLSDIAACGGRAVGLLLNLGLPDDMEFGHVQEICRGFGNCAGRHGAVVLGGDITHAVEISISATSIGRATRNKVLTRRGAQPGDSIFISRPLGMTPAAFRVFLGGFSNAFEPSEIALLKRQFTAMEPMLALGQALSVSGLCGACMDNTDGVGQSLKELSEASKCTFVIKEGSLGISPLVEKVCRIVGLKPLETIFDGGADFSLIGTLRGSWTTESASERFGHPLEIIGYVSAETREGLWIEGVSRRPLKFSGWNYFLASSQK